MSDIGQLIEMILAGIFNTFSQMARIEFLGTNLLQFSLGLLICNAVVSLMIIVNNSTNRTFERRYK